MGKSFRKLIDEYDDFQEILNEAEKKIKKKKSSKQRKQDRNKKFEIMEK